MFVLLPIVACSDAVGGDSCSAARSLDASLRLPPVTGAQTVDDEWAAIARQVPGGWGGAFLVNNQITIYLVHPEARDQAVAALWGFGIGRPQYDVHTATVLQGRWDFAQLYDWYRYVNVGAWTIEGLYYSGINRGTNRLVYGADPSAMARFDSFLQGLDLPCDLVTVEAAGPVDPL